MKNKYVTAHIKAASVYAELSSARRLKVGCVIVKNNTIIGIGYNGMPAGWDNNCEREDVVLADAIFGEPTSTVNNGLKTRPEVLHAESNAIAKVARSTNSTENATLFVTHAPCLDCAKLIYQSGICEVIYQKDYKNTDGIEFLKKCRVRVYRVE
jgi:dCMP deaminase